MAKRVIAGSRGIVTGASSGIGRAIAVELARHSAQVLAVARRKDLLDQLNRETGIAVVDGDIRDPLVRGRVLEHCQRLFGGIDFLVNAAGISSSARFAESSSERLREIMEVNFFASTELIRAALPLLRQGRSPLVVNIGSILGRRGIPWHADYCASKFALQGLGEALRPELAALGVDLLVVNPGTTQTGLYENDTARHKLPWRQPRGVSAEYVARLTVRAMAANRREIVPSTSGRLLLCLNRWFPWLIDRLMRRYG